MTERSAKGRALVVEDDRSWQQILEEILLDCGLEVDVADTVEGAVEKLRAAPHRLAVVDLSLKGRDHTDQDGLRVLDAVRRHDPTCRAVLLTGYATVDVAVRSLTEHGALTCLQKSAFRRAAFRDLVRQALAKAPPVTAVGAAAPDTAGGDFPSEMAQEVDQSGMRLALVVEDDASWRLIFAELLAEVGYQAELCGSFGDAVGRLCRGRYDLAVIDLALSLSAMRGAEHEGHRLLERVGRMPAIVVTGAASPSEIERTYAEGAFVCLEKQAFDRRAFLRAVQEAQAQTCSELDCLTAREREVLALLAQGATNQDIATALFITNNTVKRHLKAIFEKLGVHTRAAAAAKAVDGGLVARGANN